MGNWAESNWAERCVSHRLGNNFQAYIMEVYSPMLDIKSKTNGSWWFKVGTILKLNWLTGHPTHSALLHALSFIPKWELEATVCVSVRSIWWLVG